MTTHHNAGTYLRDCRIAKGLTIEKASELLGMTTTKLSSIEQGVDGMMETRLFLMASVYSIDVKTFCELYIEHEYDMRVSLNSADIQNIEKSMFKMVKRKYRLGVYNVVESRIQNNVPDSEPEYEIDNNPEEPSKTVSFKTSKSKLCKNHFTQKISNAIDNTADKLIFKFEQLCRKGLKKCLIMNKNLTEKMLNRMDKTDSSNQVQK